MAEDKDKPAEDLAAEAAKAAQGIGSIEKAGKTGKAADKFREERGGKKDGKK